MAEIKVPEWAMPIQKMKLERKMPHMTRRAITGGAEAGRDQVAPRNEAVDKPEEQKERHDPVVTGRPPQGAQDLAVHILDFHEQVRLHLWPSYQLS